MPKFGPRSKQVRATLHSDLQCVLDHAILYTDFALICGRRGRAEQEEAFATGVSKVRWPNSKHNVADADGNETDGFSRAVDIAPWPIDWRDTPSFYLLVGRIRQVADEMGIKIRCGADWDGDGKTRDQSFHDIGHIELAD